MVLTWGHCEVQTCLPESLLPGFGTYTFCKLQCSLEIAQPSWCTHIHLVVKQEFAYGPENHRQQSCQGQT